MLRSSVCLLLLVASPTLARQDGDPELDGKKASEWVKTLQNDSSARQRSLAVVALGKLWADHKFKESVPMIGRSLRLDSSVAVRTQCAATLGTLQPEDAKFAAADLVESLKIEKEPRVRKEIVTSLGRYPTVAKLAIVPLTGTLKDTDAAIRAAAATTLAQTGAEAKAAAPELLKLLDDSDKTVRQAAVFAIARISPDDSASAAAALVKLLAAEKDADMRRELVVSLGLLGERTQNVVMAIAAWLGDPDDEMRRVAARTLNTFGAAAGLASDAFLKLAKEDKDKSLRLDGVRGYASSLGPALKQNVEKLLPLMKDDPDFEVRLAIVEELGALGNELKDDKVVLEALRVRLSDPQVRVREAAAVAIRRITQKPMPVPPKKP
jgi:HEAT repeat protein